MREHSPEREMLDDDLVQLEFGTPTMEAVLTDAPAPGIDPKDAGRPRKKRQVAFWVALVWIVALTFVSVFADFIPFVKSYTQINPTGLGGKPPSSEFWFGTDKIGRDVFSRTVYGARLSLAIAGASIVFGLLIGGFLGLMAGYFKGRLDSVLATIMDVLLAFPALVLSLAITAFLGRDAKNVVLALTILSIAPLTRIVRATTMGYSNREFVLAAKSLGAKNSRVVFREVLPNVVPSMLSFALTGLAVLIIAEGALAFLGQSVAPPQPTWGGIIAEGQPDLNTLWWISVMPSVVLFLTVLAFNVLGDVMSKRFDIRESAL